MSMLVFWVSCSWSEFCSNVNKPSDRTQPAVSQLWCLWLPSRRSTASRWQALVTVTRSSADLRPPREDYLMTEDLQRSAKQRLDCWLIFNLFPQFHQKKKKKMQPKKTKRPKQLPGLPISPGSCEQFRTEENLPPNNRVCEVVNRNKRTNKTKLQARPLERRRAGMETTAVTKARPLVGREAKVEVFKRRAADSSCLGPAWKKGRQNVQNVHGCMCGTTVWDYSSEDTESLLWCHLIKCVNL